MQQIISPPTGAGPDCPRCKTKTIRVRLALVANPIGTFSIAGAQMKVTATTGAVAECTRCGYSVPGHLEDVALADDGKTVTGGRFVSDGRDRQS